MSKQINMVSLDQLVSKNHDYRKFKAIFDFEMVEEELGKIESRNNYKGYGVFRLFKCLLLQFMEDISDRELERYEVTPMSQTKNDSKRETFFVNY